MDIYKNSGNPVVIHPALRSIVGDSLEALILLGYLSYWQSHSNDDGWIYKTMDNLEKETGLTKKEQRIARKRLVVIGFLEEKRKGIPPKNYFRLSVTNITKTLAHKGTNLNMEELIEKTIKTYGSDLNNLSYMAHRNASKLGAGDYVDYQEVIRINGLLCNICKMPIYFGPGKNKNSLGFMRIIPLTEGGKHTIENIRPVHVGCSAKSRL